VRRALCILELFVALTAIAGGLALVTGLEAQRFPIAMLRGTPFHSYVIPGLLLAVVVGGSASVATAISLRRPSMAGPASVVAGIVLMGWIVGEVVLLQLPVTHDRWWEVFYFAVGCALAIGGLMVGQP
jgi:hypothetical protein